MINPIISLHFYWILNGAIMASYLISRIILCLPFFKKRVTQIQQLKFARFSFFIVVLAFFIEPPLAAMIAPIHHSNFKLEPLLKRASDTFSQHHIIVNEQLTQMNSILFFSLIIGISIFLGKYIKNIFYLKNFRKMHFVGTT